MKIHIERIPGCRDSIGIYITDHKNGKDYLIKPITLRFEELPEGEYFEPSIKLHFPEASGFLKAFADALEEFGIFRKQDPDAMKYIKSHLEDMRRLVFEPMTERIEIKGEHK